MDSSQPTTGTEDLAAFLENHHHMSGRLCLCGYACHMASWRLHVAEEMLKQFGVVRLVQPSADYNTDYYPAPEGWMVETPDDYPGAVATENGIMTAADARAVAAALLTAASAAEKAVQRG